MSRLIGYFGYGSLVNRATLSTRFSSVHAARLSGWRRHWQSRGDDIPPGVALLSIHQHEASHIDGVLVIDEADSLPALDEREKRYDRVRIESGMLTLHGPMPGSGPDEEAATIQLPDELYVYVGHPEPENAGEHRLLQSYLDTVLHGFHEVFGDAGIDGFIASTIGFEREIITDRHEPRYPRSTPVLAELASRYDRLLLQAGVRFPRR